MDRSSPDATARSKSVLGRPSAESTSATNVRVCSLIARSSRVGVLLLRSFRFAKSGRSASSSLWGSGEPGADAEGDGDGVGVGRDGTAWVRRGIGLGAAARALGEA
jgi:hypothetical protein